ASAVLEDAGTTTRGMVSPIPAAAVARRISRRVGLCGAPRRLLPRFDILPPCCFRRVLRFLPCSVKLRTPVFLSGAGRILLTRRRSVPALPMLRTAHSWPNVSSAGYPDKPFARPIAAAERVLGGVPHSPWGRQWD